MIKGLCGVCGDPFDQPRPRDNEMGGRWVTHNHTCHHQNLQRWVTLSWLFPPKPSKMGHCIIIVTTKTFRDGSLYHNCQNLQRWVASSFIVVTTKTFKDGSLYHDCHHQNLQVRTGHSCWGVCWGPDDWHRSRVDGLPPGSTLPTTRWTTLTSTTR